MSGRNVSVKITPKGFAEMVKLSQLKRVYSSPSHIELKGIWSLEWEKVHITWAKGYTNNSNQKLVMFHSWNS